MTVLSLIAAIGLCFAAATLVVGLGLRIWQYASTPVPLRIPTTPAPASMLGVVWRMTKEVIFFESLFKASKWTWIAGWLFHAGLLVILVGHLRLFVEPVWAWVSYVHTFSKYSAGAMLIGLAALFARRIFVDRVRYISAPSDHLMLVLLMAIGLTGAMMKTVTPTDVVGVKQFALGLARFDWQELPADPVLVVHLALVAVLMLIFPFSKLLHAPGVFFSPTRNQMDPSRYPPGSIVERAVSDKKTPTDG